MSSALRVLLEQRGRRDASIFEVAEALAGRPADIRRAVRRLDTRGLVRQWHAGRTERTLLERTPPGLAPVRALLAAAGQPAAAPDAAKAPLR
jgi:DNA-binding MarR family transcriptional regulator